jgi:HPt (histidine-containing phosphotransfer) domain-containing protein
MKIDMKGLAERIGLSEEEITELIGLFIESCSEDMEKLGTALEEHNARKVSEAAHSIKGASGNMRLDEIYELSKKIEMDARANKLDQAGSDAATLWEHLNDIKIAFEESQKP